MLDKDFLREWASALRSGDYVQGKGALRSKDDCYCVMGVACDLALKLGMISGDWVLYENCYQVSGAKLIAFMPKALAQQIGMGVDGSIIDEDGQVVSMQVTEDRWYRSLLDANDRGESFESLANVLERLADES